MKRNKFNKALKHLKSKNVDDKIKKLEEAAPTNSMSGVYQVSPSAGDAFRLGQPDAPKRFYTKADGTWPAGIPGDPNKVFYDRPAGYWGSGRNTTPEVGEPTKRDFTYADVTANGNTNTDQFIRSSDGKVYTALPEGSENVILGPLVTSYAINHGYDDYTNLGYIQKDTRQFVLLARIQGFFKGEDRPRTSYLSHGNIARTWDGTASQLTIYNSNFTLEYALWMKDRYEKGNFTANFPFRFSGGIPVDRHPDDSSMGSGDIMGTDEGQQSKDGDTSGTEQDAPDDNDIESLDLWGLIKGLFGLRTGLFGKGADFMKELGASTLNYLNQIKDTFSNFGNFKSLPKLFKETVNAIPVSGDSLVNYLNNNDPKHPNYRVNDPTYEGYKGPYEAKASGEWKNKVGGEMKKSLDELNNMNLKNGWKTRLENSKDGKVELTEYEINQFSEKMKPLYGNGGMEFHTLLNSLPVNNDLSDETPKNNDGNWRDYPTKVTIDSEGNIDITSNYRFTDRDDVSSGGPLMKAWVTIKLGADKGEVDNKTVFPFKDKDGGTTTVGTTHDINLNLKLNINGGNKSNSAKKDFELIKNFKTLGMDYTPDGEVLSERKRILREIKQPVLIEATPKTTKLKGYRPNFKGKYSPQNTPDVTASKKSDEAVEGYNTSRLAWTNKDKFWKGYETTERMNVIFDRVGFGQQYFDRVVAENILGNKKMQEHFNILSHEKAMREDDPNYKSPFREIDEQETYDDKVNDPLFGKVAKKLKKEIDYPDKPARAGYPNEAPPKVDPMTGYHPKYGKRYKYDKLDPVSAVMMSRAPTGDPEIDANVKKAAKQKKDHSNIDKQIDEWFFEKRKRDWRKEIDEGMTTANLVTDPYPATGLDLVINDTPTISADAFADAPARQDTEPGFSYPAMVGTNIKSSGTGVGDNGGFNIGDHIAFDGEGSTGGARWAVLKPADTTKVDTIVINAIVGNGSNGGEKPDDPNENLNLYYKTDEMNDYIPINYYPTYTNEGQKSDDVNMNLIPLNVPDSYSNNVNIYALTIPEYARTPNTRFLFYQFNSSGSGRDKYGITSVSYRRFQPMNVVVPLDSPDAISFINVGTNEGDPKKRKKKVDDMLKASDEYTEKQMGGQFPGQGSRLGDDPDPFAPAPILNQDGSPIGKDAVKKSFSDFAINAADSQTDTSQTEPESPSTQTTMEPKDEDGNEIPVTTVDPKTGAVEGSDAAKIEETDEDPPSKEEIEREEEMIKASSMEEPEEEPEDDEDLSDEEKKEKAQNRYEKLFNDAKNKIFDHLRGIDKLDVPIDLAITGVMGALVVIKNFARIYRSFGNVSNLLFGTDFDSDYYTKAIDGIDTTVNDIKIMQSYLTGRITKHNYSGRQIQSYADNLSTDLFTVVGEYGYYGTNGAIGISDTRHEYVDDNIYVKNGEVFVNDQGLASLANLDTRNPGKEKTSLVENIGKGYGQMIIPKDGGKPYFHFYDYNYLNLNSKDSDAGNLVGLDKEIPRGYQGFFADIAGKLRKIVPGRLYDDMINRMEGNLNTFNNNLKKRVGLDGWPPGIHGAALTEFKLPLKSLPKEIQDMVNAHPLSWTDERLSKMTHDEIRDQIDELTDDNKNEYAEKYEKYLRDPNQVPPDFAKAILKIDDYVEDLVKFNDQVDELQNNMLYAKTGDRRTAYSSIKNPARDAALAEYNRVLKILHDYHTKMEKVRYKGFDQEYSDKLSNQVEKIQRQYHKSGGSMFENGKYTGSGSFVSDPNATFDDFVYSDGRVVKGLSSLLKDAQNEYDEIDQLILDTFDSVEDLLKEVDGKFVQITKREKFGKDYLIPPESWTPEKFGSGKRPQDSKNFNQFGSSSTFVGGDATAAATAAASQKDDKKLANARKEAQELRWILQSGMPLTEKQRNDIINKINGLKKAEQQFGGNTQVAHFKPKGRNLFEKLKTSPFFNPKDIKPTFPEKPPGQIDPKTGMHQNYGKQAGRYKRLDPISANAMPKTGDPEIDAVVDKQKTKRTLKKIKEIHNEKNKVLK